MTTRLVSKIQEDVLLLTLKSDDGYPRLERTVLAAIETEMARLAGHAALVGCVITGSERAFAAGAEIGELAAIKRGEGFAFARRGQQAMYAVARSRKPVVAAIQGFCFGGGLDLALACHARIATDDAAFAHPGGALGIITGWGGTQRLPRLIGKARAMEIFITGRRVDAREAREVGLIREIVSADRFVEA
ncbi:MAG: enoyl-CoA hydratase/isomerase family protein, partial [Candidatus Acidiferrales bacterium]